MTEGPRILAVCQQKGGVGKTTMARNIGDWLGRRGRRTLLIDLDQQAHLSSAFLTLEFDGTAEQWRPPIHPDFDPGQGDWSGRSSSADIYLTGAFSPYPSEWAENVEIVPADGEALRAVEESTDEGFAEAAVERLRDLLRMPAIAEAYDVVVIDTGPSRLRLTRSALRAATHLLLPLEFKYANTQGLMDMIGLWRRENQHRLADPLNLLGIVPNMHQRTAMHQGMYEQYLADETISPYLLPTPIAHRISIAELDHPASRTRSVFELRQNDPARVEFTQLCGFIEQRLFAAH